MSSWLKNVNDKKQKTKKNKTIVQGIYKNDVSLIHHKDKSSTIQY